MSDEIELIEIVTMKIARDVADMLRASRHFDSVLGGIYSAELSAALETDMIACVTGSVQIAIDETKEKQLKRINEERNELIHLVRTARELHNDGYSKDYTEWVKWGKMADALLDGEG